MSRHHYPQWSYGYTLGPPSLANRGNYSMYHRGGPAPPLRGRPGPFFGAPRFGPGGRPPFRGPRPVMPSGEAGPPPGRAALPEVNPEASSEAGDTPVKPGSPTDGLAAEGSNEVGPPTKEEGEGVEKEGQERPVSEILKGRNPIMYCNDQSKFRKLHMDWEQISETGPPHDKTFTWTLKMGDMSTVGVANSKKLAKNRAAEEMAKKLDKLPRVMKRNFFQANNQFYPPGFRMPPPWMMNPNFGPPPFGAKKKKTEKNPESQDGATPGEGSEPKSSTEKSKEVIPKVINPSQNNPISKLYEHCKKAKQPEPIFETISENVLEARKTPQGFVLKKTEFTMQCTIQNKKFIGTAMTKKQAKHNAAAVAWAEIGVGVGQESINDLLETQRNNVG
ncbi:hypothetical protein TCAL_14282 [Tigriopus californicus]|uniref:DRBM domain-containing protein n=1 Tax=Tigriopus californicus TaxID=6832 RepID=A0A553NT77_TIGCA|nr:double-stranded RNA-binding protein Staufen homolog [Tigriopus californicus]TRY68623.1 hypothetical protein TCAL_14282 [Tigriopus californicus]